MRGMGGEEGAGEGGGYRGNTEKKSREGRVGIGQGSRGQLLINVPLLTSFLSCYVPAKVWSVYLN